MAVRRHLSHRHRGHHLPGAHALRHQTAPVGWQALNNACTFESHLLTPIEDAMVCVWFNELANFNYGLELCNYMNKKLIRL